MRRSWLRWPLLSIAAVLFALSVLQLFLRQVPLVGVGVGIAAAALIVAICVYDADDDPEPAVVPVPPGTENRVSRAVWGLLAFGVVAPVALTILNAPSWTTAVPVLGIVLVIGLATWRQAVAENRTMWEITKRAWQRPQ